MKMSRTNRVCLLNFMMRQPNSADYISLIMVLLHRKIDNR